MTEYVATLATVHGNLADLLRDMKVYEEAEAHYRQELSLRSRIASDRPGVISARYGHGQVLHILADLLRERGRTEEALALEHEAIKELESVYHDNVLDPEHRTAVSFAYWTLCSLELDRKDYRAAAQAVTQYSKIEPRGYEEAIESARFLCRCTQLCRADASISPTERDTLARSFADRAVNALAKARALDSVTPPTSKRRASTSQFAIGRIFGERERTRASYGA